MSCRMIFAKEFFDLQLAFAQHVCGLLGISLDRALLEYTNLYIRFGLGRELDANDAVWRAYLAGLRTTADVGGYTYEFYLRDAEATTAPPTLGRFGCFSWACEGDEAIRLHFRNQEQGDVSPLSNGQSDARRAELAALFAHAQSVVGGVRTVLGISWLYNLEAYRRLFPPAYGESRRVIRARFRGMSLWGQFLNYRGDIKQEAARQFLSALARQSSCCDLDRCFPFQVLTTEAPIQRFYAFHGL